ncbi:MAG: 3-methyl-2-oxobutanoate hydroxymethyltransferase [bacterium]|jgi:3-methyl-2-oxobutanoate hydroxymethyltransferase
MSKFVGKSLARMKRQGRSIVAITAYDLFTASIARDAGVDLVLVGDSLGNVVQGADTTIPVTLDDIVYHSRMVVRAVDGRIPVFADMPFGTFKISAEDTVRNAVRLFKDSGCDGVKLEGATPDTLEAIEKLIAIGIPVMGHTGFLPQTVHASGGFKYRGKTPSDREIIISEAESLENAGCCAIVLECVAHGVAAEITKRIDAPTIGIGSGPGCDGQILVINDLLGMYPQPPSFVSPYSDLLERGTEALTAWSQDVRRGNYPRRGEEFADTPAVKEEA